MTFFKKKNKKINLALQGGGSHGAFTWGVLNSLLEDPRLEFEAISGVSSGAMNATVMASGYIKGGRRGAKKALSEFWGSVSDEYKDLFEPGPNGVIKSMFGMDLTGALESFKSLTHNFSPYQLNPFNLNPLRKIIEEIIDFEAIQNSQDITLHIGATQVRTGKMKIFSNPEITADALLASACLPDLHHAIEINGEPYWDGGFSGNPPLFPLIFDSKSHDILVILLQPMMRDKLPITSDEIHERASELAFSTTFIREMRAIALSKEKIKSNWFNHSRLEKRMNKLKVHMVEDRSFERMDPDSRYRADANFINSLYKHGTKAGKVWLKENYGAVEQQSSVNLVEQFV